jgi:sugar phosphate isomerase/epimerase
MKSMILSEIIILHSTKKINTKEFIMQTKFAVQLYSLRNVINENFPSILEKVSKIGYDGVEFAGFHELQARELKNILTGLNLQSEGSHTSFDDLSTKFDEVIEYNQILNTNYIIIPHYQYETEEDYKKMAEFCQKTGEKVNAAGMKLLYHNHGFEFEKKFNGKSGLEILKDNTSNDTLSFQLDLYWAKYQGLDPVKLLESMKDRCATIHLKDMGNLETKKMTEVGTGIIDIKSILKATQALGIKWVTIEQDDIYIDPFESIKISLENAKKSSQN